VGGLHEVKLFLISVELCSMVFLIFRFWKLGWQSHQSAW